MVTKRIPRLTTTHRAIAARTSASAVRAALRRDASPARTPARSTARAAQREADVLLDQQHRQVAALGERDDRVLDLGDDVRLDALGRLVEDQQPRLGDQRPGDGELLALAAGQQAGAAAQQFASARGTGRAPRRSATSGGPAPSATSCRFSSVVSCAERLLALRHVGQPRRDPLVRAQPGDVLAVEQRPCPLAPAAARRRPAAAWSCRRRCGP